MEQKRKAMTLERAVFDAVPDVDTDELTQANAQAVIDFLAAAGDRLALAKVSAQRRRQIKLLLRFVVDWVARCEDRLYQRPHANPSDLLRALMADHGLQQADLIPEMGHQSTVSAVLSGRRQITAAQAQRLARRFSMKVDAFLPPDPHRSAPGGVTSVGQPAGDSFTLVGTRGPCTIMTVALPAGRADFQHATLTSFDADPIPMELSNVFRTSDPRTVTSAH